MPKQSLSTPFNQRPSKIKPPKKVYHLIFEGRTEKDYFEQLNNHKLLVDNCYIRIIAKNGIERDMSDRMEMVKTATDYMVLKRTG